VYRYYEVVGKGRDSGRARRRTYRATDEADARAQAEKDGTVVETVQVAEVTGPPPSERQIKFARDLGMEIPPGATADDVSDLIDEGLMRRAIAYAKPRGFKIPQNLTDDEGRDLRAAEEAGDVPSDESDRALAERYGVSSTPLTGKSALYHRILLTLKEGRRERELAEWFAFRVYRHRVKEAGDAPIRSPDDPLVQEVARIIAADEQLLKSVRRYDGDLLHFGEWTDSEGYTRSGESDNSMAYKRASEILRSRAGPAPRAPPSRKAEERPAAVSRTNPEGRTEARGFPVALVLVVLALAIVVLMAVLG
jgi:hypothetical protein